MILYTDGIGGTLGAKLATLSPLYAGNVYYVHTTGSDSNAGTERQKPFATLAHAVTVASSSGGIIVVLAGHRELLAANASVHSGVSLIGEGEGSERPVFWSPDDVTTLTLNGANFVSNIAVDPAVDKTNVENPSLPRIVSTNAIDLDGVVLTMGDINGAVAMTVSGDSSSRQSLRNGSFIVLRTSTPLGFAALSFSSSGTIAMDNVTIDGGEQGFSVPAIARVANTDATAIQITNLSLLNGADISLAPGGSGAPAVGFVHVSASSGAAKVIL